MYLIFRHHCASENFLPPKFSQTAILNCDNDTWPIPQSGSNVRCTAHGPIFARLPYKNSLIWLISCTHLQLINYKSYNFLVYLQVLLVNICLNQTWIALLTALICAFPVKALRLSPVIAAVAGFTSGFFIPIGALNWGWEYLKPHLHVQAGSV